MGKKILQLLLGSAIGLGLGLLLSLLAFTSTMAVASGFAERSLVDGLKIGLVMLFTAVFYMLLYIVVVVKTVLPASLLTGLVAGASPAVLRHRAFCWIPGALTGLVGGAWQGYRMSDMVLEGLDKWGDRVAGGVAMALTLALGAVVISLLTRALFGKEDASAG